MISLRSIFASNLSDGFEEGAQQIIFFGDSITELGSNKGGFLTILCDRLQTAVAGRSIMLTNAGVGGNKVPDLLDRLDRDILARRPAVVVVYIGVNDVWHWEQFNKGTTERDYEGGLTTIVRRIIEAGARMILCTPAVIGERKNGDNSSDALLERYAQISRTVASSFNITLCDLRRIFLTYLKERNSENKPDGILTVDGVHLSDEGNNLVATAMLPLLVDMLPASL
jgi:lysophospholipase L1-like esterase